MPASLLKRLAGFSIKSARRSQNLQQQLIRLLEEVGKMGNG
ncbi:MAG: hypothetical protein V7K69_31375 [Nostoc sp.]